ncbi:hypothetical protein MKX03_004467, partial [Papaver bracteatum]
IEAGTPEDYYLNPTDNLWKVASMWKVDEQEDVLVLTIDMRSFGDVVIIHLRGKLICIEVRKENKEKAARFDHEDGMKFFDIEMNPNFLKLVPRVDDNTIRSAFSRQCISKLTPEEIKNYAERKNDPKPEGYMGLGTVMLDFFTT